MGMCASVCLCAIRYVRVNECRFVCVYVCASWMYVGQCMGAIMPAYHPICMRMHVGDAGWWVFVCMAVCVCVCVFIAPNVNAQVGVHEFDYVFAC